MRLFFKRVAGILAATMVWTWRDWKDDGWDYLETFVRNLVGFVLFVVLLPLLVASNWYEAWKLRGHITKDTSWFKRRRLTSPQIPDIVSEDSTKGSR